MDVDLPGKSRTRLVLICLSFTLLLDLPIFFIPEVGGILGVGTPVPVAAAFLLGGTAAGLAVTGSAALIVGAVAGAKGALFFILEAGLMGIMLAAAMRRRLPYPHTVALVSGTVLLAHFAASFVISGSTTGLPASMQAESDRALDLLGRYLAQNGEKGAPPLSLEHYRDLFSIIFPGLFVLGALFNALLCALVTARIVPQTPGPRPSFTAWRMPDAAIWVFIALAFTVVMDYRALWGAPAGLLIVLAFFYTAQGFAVALDLAHKRNVAGWIRFILIVAVLFQPPLLAFFLVVGLLDFRFDFRRPRAAVS